MRNFLTVYVLKSDYKKKKNKVKAIILNDRLILNGKSYSPLQRVKTKEGVYLLKTLEDESEQVLIWIPLVPYKKERTDDRDLLLSEQSQMLTNSRKIFIKGESNA